MTDPSLVLFKAKCVSSCIDICSVTEWEINRASPTASSPSPQNRWDTVCHRQNRGLSILHCIESTTLKPSVWVSTERKPILVHEALHHSASSYRVFWIYTNFAWGRLSHLKNGLRTEIFFSINMKLENPWQDFTINFFNTKGFSILNNIIWA